MNIIKPGTIIKLVTGIDWDREKIHVRSSVVHDVQGSQIILAQTDPPITDMMLSKEVVVTYLHNTKKEGTRHGFPAKVERFIDDYRLSDSQTARTIAVVRTGEPKIYSLRMFYRVCPDCDDSRLQLFIYGKKTDIIDIGLRGIKFRFDSSAAFQLNQIVELHLEINGRRYSCFSLILRIQRADDEGSHRSYLASAEFIDLSETLEPVLVRKIRAIEREERDGEAREARPSSTAPIHT
jgi:hypothetical protein